MPERITYKGMDPPPEDWKVEEEPEPVAVPQGKAPAKGKADPVPAPEVQKSPEVEAADKTVKKFMKQFMTNILQMQADLNEYRMYASGVNKVALWPKKLTAEEIQAIKEKDEADRKAREEEEARLAEEAAALAATQNQKGKGAAKNASTPRPASSK